MQRNDTIEVGREALRIVDETHHKWLREVPAVIGSTIRRVTALVGYGGIAFGLGSLAAESETGEILPTPLAVVAAVIGGLALGYNTHYFLASEAEAN